MTQTVEIDPMKYLANLPNYDGNFFNLYTFIDLIDRISFVLEKYNEDSQKIFLDIIKSKLVGQAKDLAEINNHLTKWTELKTVLTNNFGDRLSTEQLYDQLRSLKFKTTAKVFYDEIITTLRRLNMKTKITDSERTDYNQLIIANKRTALEVFKRKLAEPMRSIILCRDPSTLEAAMNILYECNYAYYNPNPSTTNTGKTKQSKYYKSKDTSQGGNPSDQYDTSKTYTYTKAYNNSTSNQNEHSNNNDNRDRPSPMEVGNFQQEPSTSSPT